MLFKKISLASDHAGFKLKEKIKKNLKKKKFTVVDLGPKTDSSVDYPDFAKSLANAILKGKVTRGVLICGSGIGISIAANRYLEIRAALVHDTLAAKLSREHNNANVIAFGGRMIKDELALKCLEIFLNTEFEGGRHARRVDKLSIGYEN